MRLRRQLLIVSLVTLALPWVGCQTVREMDAALRQSQADALAATAAAVSARISSDPALIKELPQLTSPADSVSRIFYAHQLPTAPFIDGYDDDWLTQGYTLQALNNDTSQQVVMAAWQKRLIIFARVETGPQHYFNPTQANLARSDHLRLHTKHGSYAVFASGPGQLQAVRLAPKASVNDKTREHQIKGVWLEQPQGYQVEFSLPLVWAQDGLALTVVPANSTPPSFTLRPVITHSQRLTDELQVFASAHTRLHILTETDHLLASAGSLSLQSPQQEHHGLMAWLYSIALDNPNYPPLRNTSEDGTYALESTEKSTQALAHSQESRQWYQLGGRPVARVSQKLITPDGQARGVIIAERSADSMASAANHAFSKLLVYSFLASTLAAISLVIYATWLSLRIRKLNAAAAHAISDSGKIADDFPVLNSQDELGELSRSYAQLLARLREYTNYLRTLSSKLSHELRTPLAIVRSSLDNLEHEKLGKQAKVYADRAREGTTRLSNILNAMSAASRVEQAIGASEREVIPCDELLSNLKDAYEDVYQHVNFALNIRRDPKGLHVQGSGELLVQAMDKLVDNAADFCPSGGRIELGLYRHNDNIVFTIHNEGPPLPSHMHGQLFDSMVSVRDKAITETSHHLGLGLYIVRLITDFHGGEVQGYNVPDNSGVIFELRLPAAT